MNDLELEAFEKWYTKGIDDSFISKNFCETRSDFNGRLSTYEALLNDVIPEECLYLLISSIGEVGNNCFDHNLGHWQNKPGCLFIREKQFAIVADRGRGIKQSLSQTYTLDKNEDSYIQVAFNKIISGRAPERRGNGLKFTKKNILNCNMGLYCLSDSEKISFGLSPNKKVQNLIQHNLQNSGTITFFYW